MPAVNKYCTQCWAEMSLLEKERMNLPYCFECDEKIDTKKVEEKGWEAWIPQMKNEFEKS